MYEREIWLPTASPAHHRWTVLLNSLELLRHERFATVGDIHTGLVLTTGAACLPRFWRC